MTRFLGSLRFALLAITILALPLLALAQEVPPQGVDPADIGQLFGAGLQALSLSGPARWFSLLFIGVLLAVWAVRKFVPATTQVGAFIRTSEGGTVVGWLVSAAGALLAKAMVGGALSWPIALAAFVAAAGGTGALWTQGRRLLRLLVPLVAKIPGAGGALASLLTYLSGADSASIVAKQAAAGFVAVPAGLTPQQAAELLARPPAK